jgi:hypothetical protein
MQLGVGVNKRKILTLKVSRPTVLPVAQQMSGKGVPKGVTCRSLSNAGAVHRTGHGALHQ